MSDMNGTQYDEAYYKSHCGANYERNNGWEEIFSKYAEHIIKELNPDTVLDVGCAVGYLVESLRDRGIEAEGIDISDYAIANVRPDMKPYCRVQDATIPIQKKYHLITCIEMMEHLPADKVPVAIENICKHADMIIFSSTPFDYDEQTHVSVHAPSYWVEQFAYNHFYHDVRYDCSWLSVQAMLFRRVEKTQNDLIRDYEEILFQKHQETVALRHQLQLSFENVENYKSAYQKHVDMINEELNPKIQQLTKENEELKSVRTEKLEKPLLDVHKRINELSDTKEHDSILAGKIECSLLEIQRKIDESIEKTNENSHRVDCLEQPITELQSFICKTLQESVESSQKKFDECIKKIDVVTESATMDYQHSLKMVEQNFRLRVEDEVERRKNIEKEYLSIKSEMEEIKRTSNDKREKLERELEETKRQYELRIAEWNGNQEEYQIKADGLRRLYDDSNLRLTNMKIQNDMIESLMRHERNNRCVHIVSTNLKSFLSQKRRWKAENKKLLAKDSEYWKPVFDAKQYMKYNPDIAEVYGDDSKALLKHFICYGMLEERRAKDDFDVSAYLLFNPDVANVLGNDSRAYYLHYIENGQNEGRRAVF